ncbi:hypothetical protein CsSME_00032294 [Camellia sinensis var. sinensis]
MVTDLNNSHISPLHTVTLNHFIKHSFFISQINPYNNKEKKVKARERERVDGAMVVALRHCWIYRPVLEEVVGVGGLIGAGWLAGEREGVLQTSGRRLPEFGVHLKRP